MPLSDDDRATLSAYLDGELDEAAVQQVESRLSLDSEARAEYETRRQTWSLLDYLPRAKCQRGWPHRWPLSPPLGSVRRLHIDWLGFDVRRGGGGTRRR
jgi:anti-sigma factor RsiW